LSGSDPLPTITAPASLPNNHGFDEFYGYLNHGAAHDYFYSWMWQTQVGSPNGVAAVANNGGPGGTAQYTHDLIAARSEQFITAHAGDADPFYMQVSYTIPHWDIDQIASAPGGYGIYASQPWTSQQKAYAAMITRMDASFGSLIQRLKDPNGDTNESDSILSDTLIIFSSDNGPTIEDDSPIDFFNANGPYRGGKFEVYEGGIHMPSFAYWPGQIAAGSSTAYRTDMADFMATAADLAGVETPVGIDGTSIAPTLTGEGRQRVRDYLIVEQQGGHGQDPDPRVTRWTIIRQDGMKLIRYDDESSELFNLNTDPDENSPLSLGIPANATLASELESLAIAEGVTRATVEYRTYTGPNGGNVQADASWDGVGPPTAYWSAVAANTTASPRIAHVSADVSMLGFEVRGQQASGPQVIDVHPGRTLMGRNEVRVGANGRVELSGGTLASKRWMNVRAGGEIRGQGTVSSDVHNEGTISPGRPTNSQTWPIVTPAAIPAANLDTGIVTALAFDFTGVQDDVPLFAASTQSPYIEVTKGLDWGPGTGPRWGSGGSNTGDELNHIGHATSSLTTAITAGNYISFTVDPVNGAGIVPSSISFRLWRNGSAAAQNFAILSSISGFTSGAALATATYTDTGMATQHTFTASIPGSEAISGPIEFRLYGWGATVNTGNTHVNLVTLSGRFLGTPTLEFNFAGVQDNAPLTALKRNDVNLTLTSGLNFGPGVSPRGANNAGNEFHVAGFSTGATQQSALDGNDYLSFAVQPVNGMAMYPDSVSFTMWRHAGGSAQDYAVFSSVGGFASGQQLAQVHNTTTGAGNQFTLTGNFASPQPTTSPVEFRLYGWSAGSTLDSTHVTGASMRARFASVAGVPIDPTGNITVQGDFYHLDGGILAVDLGGTQAGVNYDQLNVVGEVELEGNLDVSLADIGGNPFAPALGNTFNVLTATHGITGQFDEVELPQLLGDIDWRVDYLANSVRLVVLSAADFNRDGDVDAKDYVVWRNSGGSQAQYNLWRAHFGETVNPLPGAFSDRSNDAAVPEPTAIALIGIAALILGCFRRRREY
jgi:hypothetical protein